MDLYTDVEDFAETLEEAIQAYRWLHSKYKELDEQNDDLQDDYDNLREEFGQLEYELEHTTIHDDQLQEVVNAMMDVFDYDATEFERGNMIIKMKKLLSI